MPNWCNNVVRVAHNDPVMIQRMINAAGPGILQEFIPCPEDLQIDKVSYGNDADKQAVQDAKERANVAKHGYPTWYEWNIANWGTKWDLCETEVQAHDANNITLTFDTAWAPPVDAYGKLEALGFEIEAYFYEPGMQFAGIYENGSCDDYTDWGNADGAATTLPRALDEMFGISENQAMWEEDEETVDNDE